MAVVLVVRYRNSSTGNSSSNEDWGDLALSTAKSKLSILLLNCEVQKALKEHTLYVAYGKCTHSTSSWYTHPNSATYTHRSCNLREVCCSFGDDYPPYTTMHALHQPIYTIVYCFILTLSVQAFCILSVHFPVQHCL